MNDLILSSTERSVFSSIIFYYPLII